VAAGAVVTGAGGAGGFGGATGTTGRGGTVAAGALGAGAGGLTTGAGATGLASCAGGGVAGRTGGAGGAEEACCLARMAFSTSPGLEMCERSILGLIPSASGLAPRADFEPWPSPEPWKCARTFSASWSSSELEWVFFSVTPTSGRTSRIALLLTSSSLARSLIRILLIRLFVPPDCPAKSSYQPRVYLQTQLATSRFETLQSSVSTHNYSFFSAGSGDFSPSTCSDS
jgi:hypothetical protein